MNSCAKSNNCVCLQQRQAYNWIKNKSNWIFNNFRFVNKDKTLVLTSLQVKSSKYFLFLAKLNLNVPLTLTNILPILWQVNKKTQNQNTLYFIFKKYWLNLKIYYFYMQLKKGKNKKITKKINTKLLFWKAFKRKLYYTLFFKNIIKTKYNINRLLKLSTFSLKLPYGQSSTIIGFAAKPQAQQASTIALISPFLPKTKKIFFHTQLLNKDFFFFNKLKKVKNIEKTFKVFIEINDKVIQNKIYLYTYYFNLCL